MSDHSIVDQVAGHVVVGTDGSDPARHAMEWGAAWAGRADVPLTLLLATPQLELPARGAMVRALKDQGMLDRHARSLRNALDQATSAMAAKYPSVDIDARVVEDDPAAALVRVSKRARLIVVGSSGRGGVTGQVLGSVASAVIPHAQCPVVVVPHAAVRRGPVVCGVDGGDADRRIVSTAADEAAATGSDLLIRHVWQPAPAWGDLPPVLPPEIVDDVTASWDKRLADLIETIREAHRGLHVERQVVIGDSASELADASATASLVVVGNRGRGGFTGLLLGSTSRTLIRKAKCPVLVVKA